MTQSTHTDTELEMPAAFAMVAGGDSQPPHDQTLSGATGAA